MLPEAALAGFVATLFSMMNPIGNMGVFAGLTVNQSDNQARQTARTCRVKQLLTVK